MVTFNRLGKMGRLGNQLFQVASTIGIAEKNNQEWAFPEWDHPFKAEFPVIDKRKFKTKLVPWGYHDVVVEGDISLQGYMQSERYFKHCEDKIRELFYLGQPSIGWRWPLEFIAVHVRRGDYNGTSHAILGEDYYTEALKELPKKPIVLFSDDREEAKRVVPVHTSCFEGDDPVADLMMMSTASYHVIANSSFSWWGAWLSGSKKVIAPKQWFGPKKKHWETKDIYPEGWIVI